MGAQSAAVVTPLSSVQTRQDVAALLEVSEKYLTYLLYGPTRKRTYVKFAIPKRSGGTRSISVPPKPLRALQEKLKRVFEQAYQPKPSVHGFVEDRSVVTNALPHIRKRWVLNIDLEGFFPSINFGRVRGMLIAKPYQVGASAASVMARICCESNELPQGAPTSPIVANMICARMDGQLQQLARKLNCTYTRYADDLSFSTRSRDFPAGLAVPEGGWTGKNVKLGSALSAVISANGFKLNEMKTRLQFRDCHQDVTGVVVNRHPNVRRSFVREIRAMIHAWEKHGLDAAEQRFRERYDRRARRPGAGKPVFRLVLKGKIDYLQMVRGRDDRLYRMLRNQVHELDPELVKEALPIKPERLPNDSGWSYWARRYQRSVYHVEIRTANGDVKGGTAFAFRRGLLATAEHLLIGDVEVEAPLPSKVSIGRVGVHPMAASGIDVAVLSLPLEQGRIPVLPVDTTLPERGDPVAVLGYPSVAQRHPALGVFVGLVESIVPDYKGHVFIQVSASLAGGMSGGPLINAAGSVIGIVSEQTFENTAENVPGRAFHQVLPIKHLLEVDLATLTDIGAYVEQRRGILARGIRKLVGTLGRVIKRR